MKKILIIAAMNLLIFAAAGSSLAEEKIVICGTGDSQGIFKALAAAFEKANPGTKVEVQDPIGTSGGIKAVAEGRCVLGRTARPIKEKEKAYNLNYKVFANTLVVFAVNPSVKGVDNLTFKQIVGIFSGKITSWAALGAEDRKIYMAQREKGDSCRIVLEENIPGWREIENFPGGEIFTTPEAVSTVAKYEDTIGYLPLSAIKGTSLVVIKVEGVYPSMDNVINGSYKLVVPLGLVWKGELKGLAKDFVDFIFSPEGKKIIAENE
jgi:phosphate transport system substrate-binding protein